MQPVIVCPTTLTPDASDEWYLMDQIANATEVHMTATFIYNSEWGTYFSNEDPPYVKSLPDGVIIPSLSFTFSYTPEGWIYQGDSLELELIIDVSGLDAANDTIAILIESTWSNFCE